MIRLGLDDDGKLAAIDGYLAGHPDVARVIVFSPDARPLDGGGRPFEAYGWSDIIMYRVFYPLLEKIDRSHLIVCNELLLTANRSDLTYNCLRHYLNQTPHRIVFQWFPLIDAAADFMILADCEHPGRYKGRGYSPAVVADLDIAGEDRRPAVSVTPVGVPAGAEAAYKRERDRLFDGLGSRDPDTIPRQLHIWAGKYKRAVIDPAKLYVARNARFGLPNVATYKTARGPDRISIDIPHARKELNEYLCVTKSRRIEFLATPFKIDQYYAGELRRWHETAGEIYDQAGIRP